jgi:hypothetical protein
MHTELAHRWALNNRTRGPELQSRERSPSTNHAQQPAALAMRLARRSTVKFRYTEMRPELTDDGTRDDSDTRPDSPLTDILLLGNRRPQHHPTYVRC